MIILDENFPESQRQLLRGWRVPLRQIGYEVGRKGMQDDEIFGCVPPFTRSVLRREIGLALGRALRPLVQDYP